MKRIILITFLISQSFFSWAQWTTNPSTNDAYNNNPSGRVGIGTGTTSLSAQFQVKSSTASTGNNTAQFEAPSIGSFPSHIHWGTNGDWYIRSANGAGKVIIQDTGGNVGIGSDTPGSKLEISGTGQDILKVKSSTHAILNIESTGSNVNPYLRLSSQGVNKWSIYNNYASEALYFSAGDGGAANVKMVLNQNGNVGIGTTVPDAKLAVKGTIHTEEVRVDLSVPGPDYVFESSYNLPTLEELNAYIKINKHLPEVPSAYAMEANGVNLGEMNMLLLKKVEELTLYILEQNKKSQQQQEDLDALKKQIGIINQKLN